MPQFDDDIISIWVAAGVGVYGTTIFQSSHAKLPDVSSPTSFLLVIEYPGSPVEVQHTSRTTPAYELPTAQCTAHGNNRAATIALARAAFVALSKNPATKKPWRNITINGTYYVSLTPVQSPGDRGPDDVGRLQYGFNVGSRKRPAT